MADFNETAAVNGIPIIFPAGQIKTTITVTITDDKLIEGTEHFFGQIQSDNSSIVIFAPTATVNILDNDSKFRMYYTPLFSSPLLSSSVPSYLHSPCCINIMSPFHYPGLILGFEQNMYTFNESVGIAFLSVRLSPESGKLTEDLVFSFSTNDITAIGKLAICWFDKLEWLTLISTDTLLYVTFTHYNNINV